MIIVSGRFLRGWSSMERRPSAKRGGPSSSTMRIIYKHPHPMPEIKMHSGVTTATQQKYALHGERLFPKSASVPPPAVGIRPAA